MPNQAVQHTRELARILALPRRTWGEEEATSFARKLTDALRLPTGTMSLRPIQAISLYEIAKYKGAILSVRVGGGKTLVSLLSAYVMGARRPLLLLPAKLVEKTKREMRLLAQHWPILNFIRIESYELLGRAQAAAMLERYQPDLIIADEAHKLKNAKAAVTRRVARYMHNAPDTWFIAMSGTLTKRSLLDYAHLVKWALKGLNSPLPNGYNELQEWADALDEKPQGANPVDPGALLLFSTNPLALDQRREARVSFRKRFTETPGVVATSDRYLGASLSIDPYRVKMGQQVEDAISNLTSNWELPDGTNCVNPLEIWRHIRELALGFYYRWDPRPPDEWLAIRKDWSMTMRGILSGNHRDLDSEVQVINAIDLGYYPQAEQALENWRRVKDTVKLNTVPVWLDDSAIDACARWVSDAPGILWCEHRAFAIKLAMRTLLSYYAEEGLDAQGRYIENALPGQSVIASVASNLEGRNLQHLFARNLITSCPPNGSQFEQLIGRTHRDGQKADEVTVDILISNQCHLDAWTRAQGDALYVQEITGQEQKILYADVSI